MLIADDDAMQRTLLRATLLQLGYDVEQTCDEAHADGALYQAKSLGRNRIGVHHGEPAALDMEGFAALSNRFDYPTR